MSELTSRDIEHIFESLRKGVVPERGIEAIAEGIETRRGELHRQLELAKSGEGAIKFLRGGYGCGKTFTARLAVRDAQERNFATSFVVVSDNDLQFHRFEEVYQRVMGELGTASCPRGALGDILDRWIGAVEERLIAGGANADAAEFDAKVRAGIEQDLEAHARGAMPEDFVRVVHTIFDLKQAGDGANAGALVSWLCGSTNVSSSAKRLAGIKGDIGSTEAMAYLRGVLTIVKAAGYAGLVVVIDEAETILRMRTDVRGKSLNGIRQIADESVNNHGLLWIFTGTPDFFDTRRGVAGLEALHQRIRFSKHGGFANPRQPQLELEPFDRVRLRAVALRLRALYPTKDRVRMDAAASDAFVERLVEEVTKGFKGDVGIVPRQFLRDFVDQLDLVDQNPTYDPQTHYEFKVPQPPVLRRKEGIALSGAAAAGAAAAVKTDDDSELVPHEDVW